MSVAWGEDTTAVPAVETEVNGAVAGVRCEMCGQSPSKDLCMYMLSMVFVVSKVLWLSCILRDRFFPLKSSKSMCLSFSGREESLRAIMVAVPNWLHLTQISAWT